MLTRFKVKTSLRVYTVIVKVSWDGEMIERVDVYDNEIGFNDRPKFLGEANWIGGWVDEPFTHTLKPVELAKKTIEEYERPQKLENYLRLKSHFIHMNEEEEEAPAKVTPPPKPAVYDHEQRAYENYITYLTEHPEEIDELPEMERKKLLKENLSLRLAYHEWRATQRAAKRQQQRAGGDK